MPWYRQTTPSWLKATARRVVLASMTSDFQSLRKLPGGRYVRFRALHGHGLWLRDAVDERVCFDVLFHQPHLPPFPMTPKLIVDAGAHCGVTAAHLATRYPDATILALEADAKNCEHATINLRPWPHVTVRHVALSPTRGTVTFGGPQSNTGHIGGGTATVEAITIPDIVEQYGPIDLLKLDIEGGEWALLEASHLHPSLIKCALVEWHEGCHDARDGIRQLQEAGFVVRAHPAQGSVATASQATPADSSAMGASRRP